MSSLERRTRMEEKDIITMNLKELRRLHVVNKVLEKQLRQKEAASILGLSERQIRRITKAVREEGEVGIIHKHRGRPSNRHLPVKVKNEALRLCKYKYKGFGPTLATEKLEEVDKIKISRETLRKWLLETSLWKKERKRRAHRTWRPRKERKGEMVLLDGSHHDWLEGRGPELVLMGYIDDATSTVFAKFYDYEGTLPAMDSFKEYIKKHGIPVSVYLDKHSTYKSQGKLTIEEELEGKETPLSQFERACYELGVKVIHANSPQAKGRVERLFGVFQDRLIKEMRLAGIKTKEEANTFLNYYLPKHNKKFGVQSAKKEDLHQKVPTYVDLDQILCIKATRYLRNDNTISFEGKLYLVEERLTKRAVSVEQRIDGSLHLSLGNRYLKYKQVKERPKKKETKLRVSPNRKPHMPPADHPWRKPLLNNYQNQINQEEVPSLSSPCK